MGTIYLDRGNKMLVILTDRTVLNPQAICPGCLWASSQGEPRWQHERLGCGRLVRDRTPLDQPPAYECQMGFQLVDVEKF
jgi:hypothetical protein